MWCVLFFFFTESLLAQVMSQVVFACMCKERKVLFCSITILSFAAVKTQSKMLGILICVVDVRGRTTENWL